MKCRTLSFLPFLVVLTLTLALEAQTHRPPSPGNAPTVPRSSNPNTSSTPSPRSFFLYGKVIVDDGTPLTDPATIQSNCKGRIRTEGYTDRKGGFSLEISNVRQRVVGGMDQAIDSAPSQADFGSLGTPTARPGANSGGTSEVDTLREWRECQLQAVLPGFTSQVLELAGRITNFGTDNVGTIVLHRLDHVEGFTISATSASAPGKAKKEFEKGREMEKKQKWDAAQQALQKAVEVYPQYAVAWFELGQVQVQKSDTLTARQSFHQAAAADAKFISPYQALAQLALREKQWQELVDATDQLLKLNSVNFPQYWFLNAAGHYYLQHFDLAEKNVLQGLKMDVQHQIPKMEYLLGAILAHKRDYQGAAEHMQNYLRLAPGASDASAVQKQLDEVQKLSAKVENK
jgi:tetratricopeptide (TPR) repeat protein